jgi:hypothetical protein
MDNTKCTSLNCPYKNKCMRQFTDDPDDPNQSYYNYEYTCNINDGFSYYIPNIRSNANEKNNDNNYTTNFITNDY